MEDEKLIARRGQAGIFEVFKTGTANIQISRISAMLYLLYRGSRCR